MKKFLIIVISLVMLAIVAYGAAYLIMPVSSMELNKYTHSVGFECDDAYIVRDEAVYYSKSAGVVYNISQDGARVAQDEDICTIYDGDVDNDSLKMLNTIDKQINTLKSQGHSSNLYATDTDDSESEISTKMSEISELALANDVTEVSAVKAEINAVRKGADTVSVDTRVNTLTKERDRIEQNISARKSDISSDRAGIFSSYVDGLETKLVPDSIEKLTAKGLNSLKPETSEYLNGKQITANMPVCKVMNNHIWYIVGIVTEERAKQLSSKASVTVRFTNLTEADVPAEIYYISEPDEEGNCIFALKASTYIESAFSYRNVDTQIIFEEYSGYKVPTDAVRTRDGKIHGYYVMARQGSEQYECDVDVLYSDMDGEYAIIRSKTDAENKLGVMDRLVVGER